MTVAACAHGRAQNVGASVVHHVTMQRQSLKRPKRSRCDGAAMALPVERPVVRIAILRLLVNGIPRLRGESASRSHCKSRAAWSSARRGYVRCSVDRRVGIDPLSWPDWQPSAGRFNLEDPHASPRNSAKARFPPPWSGHPDAQRPVPPTARRRLRLVDHDLRRSCRTVAVVRLDRNTQKRRIDQRAGDRQYRDGWQLREMVGPHDQG